MTWLISYEDVSLWGQQEYKRHDFMTYISGPLTSDFGQIIKVKIFVPCRFSRPINGSKLILHMRVYLCEVSRNIQQLCVYLWPIFHRPLILDFVQIIKVKIFVQGRILSSTNGSKLIFYMCMCLYKTSWKIQEQWPNDLHFTVCWLKTVANFLWLRLLS